MIEEDREDGKQDHVDVVETRGSARDRSLDVAEAALFKVVDGLREILGGAHEERKQGGSDDLGTVPHNHRPKKWSK